MPKTKVLYAITKARWGGAGRYVADLASNLPQDQFEVAVALGGEGELADKLREQNIRVINLPRLERDINLLTEPVIFWQLVKIYRQVRPDIIHLNSSKIGGLGALAGRLYNLIRPRRTGQARIIFTVHGWPFNEPRPWWQKLLIKKLSYLTILLCHRVIVIAESELAVVKHWPFIKNKLVMIKNGIDLSAARRVLDGHGKGSPCHLVTIAELQRNKGLDYLIKAVASLGQNPEWQVRRGGLPWQLDIIGEGEERRKLEELIKNRKLETRIKLLGAIPDAAKLLTGYDLFILPSLKEGLPYVLLEAGLAGLPVIASQVGGIPEIIEDGKTGRLVAPGNPVALTKAIAEALTAGPELKRWAQALQAKVMAEFSLDRMVRQTRGCYNK